MQYEGTVYRPPVEADTFLLQVEVGCTHNKCAFCNMFKDKRFHLVPMDKIERDLQEARQYYMKMERIFLVDGDAFALSAGLLEQIIEKIHFYFPECETISMYASVKNVKMKSDEDLIHLRNLGVNDLYIGHETGLDEVLTHINKGHTIKDSEEQMERLNKFGIRHHALLMIGLGGKDKGIESGLAAARLVNKIKPGIIIFTTLAIFPETSLYEEVQNGSFVEAGEREILKEQKTILENVNLPNTYLWANHILNSTPIAGFLGKDKKKMLETLEYSIENINEELFKKSFRRTTL
ncbi:radical SAM protein [Clostridium tyrobutyricum]|uniref:radical SAM protein n=1 Tax=Clostridium tyrobutyricum TaxID=1519 RepID=UPI0011CA22B5|nr:radical SAM protein [Clostridium tyrobutyricum]